MMFLFLLVVYIKGCILAGEDSVFTNGFSNEIQWVYIEDYANFDFDYCDFIVATSPRESMGSTLDSLLVEYVKRGGNLYFESQNFAGYPYLARNIQYVVSRTYTEDSVNVMGTGIFTGLKFYLPNVPELFFTIDSTEAYDYLKIDNVPIIGESVILFASPLGKGSIIVSSFPFMTQKSRTVLRERIQGYFFPDISIITDSLREYLRGLVERMYLDDHVFMRVYKSEFQGVPAGKLIVVDVPQNVVGPDSTTIFYMGPSVCTMLSSCDTVAPYITFYLRENTFSLKKYNTLSVKNGGRNEIVFTNESGETVGFISLKEKIGFIPFKLENLVIEDLKRFLLKLFSFSLGSSDVREKLDCFKGALSGVFSNAESLIVFTIDGRVVYKSQGEAGLFYDFTSLPDGLYIIKLRLNTGKDSLMLLNKLQGEKQ